MTPQTFTAVDKDGNGKIDFFSVAPFQVLKVNYVNKTEFRLSNNMKYTIEDVNVYDGIAKDDYVVYTAAANTATDTDTFVKADMISGKITQKDGNDVYVDGNWYTLDAKLQRRRATPAPLEPCWQMPLWSTGTSSMPTSPVPPMLRTMSWS